MAEAQPAPSRFAPKFEALFSKLVFCYTGRGYQNREFPYRLFVPEIASSSEKFPLIVWLHGLGDAGDNNSHHLVHLDRLIFRPPWQRQGHSFFLLAVQCPPGNTSWTTSDPAADDMVNVAMAILEQTIRDYPVDPTRIALAGLSSGGSGCWELAMRYPDVFSCVAPISCGSGDVSRLHRLLKVPVWSFYSGRDDKSLTESAREGAEALRVAGGTVKLTQVNTIAQSVPDHHDAWTQAFFDHDLLNWLLAQRQGQGSLVTHWGWLRHGYLNWENLWPRLIPVSILVLGVIAWRLEVRRRARINISNWPKPDWNAISIEGRSQGCRNQRGS